jgi:lysozyme
MNHLFTGIVENRDDPLKLGRCQVRIMGKHTYDKSILPTADLPWAYPMQAINSAAMNGIGRAPIGAVEGTTVVVMFRDHDEQNPIIIGTLGGIPQTQNKVDEEDNGPVLKQDGYTPTPNSTTVTDENGDTITTDTPTPDLSGANSASSYKPSQDALNLIKQYEGLRLTAYQDSAGVWTIGYGSTRINGAPVRPGQTITQAQADAALMDHLNKQVAPSVNSSVKAPITQSMYDALCCFTYNLGGGALAKSSLAADLNSPNYDTAANDFLMYNKAGGKVLPGLTKRRAAEQALFLKDGTPDPVTGGVTPKESPVPPVDSPEAKSAGTAGTPTSKNMEMGFKDPKGKYPLYLNEPDTNRLARHEEIKKTVVYNKELARETNVECAQGRSWNQSPIPYNAKYPFNHVYMSESGHIMEFDDTKNSERYHLYHKSGTWEEIDANGTKVNRIVGDKFEILERNGNVLIKGTANLTIRGDHNVKIENALRVDISGVTTINVFNDVNMNVSGKMDLSVKEDLNIRAKSINMETYDYGNFNIKSANAVNVQSAFAQSFKAGASFNVDSMVANINSGTAGDALSAGLSTPVDKENPSLPEFSELVVVTRELLAASQYETPEDGDSSTFLAQQAAQGNLPANPASGTDQGTVATSPNNIQPLPASCDTLSNMKDFPPDLQLSSKFSLGQLNANGTRSIVDQVGLTKAQIVCNLKGLCENVLDKIVVMYPGMRITSGFRRPGDVSESSKTSQHYNGEAADIVINGLDRKGHYDAIQAIQKAVPYDKLILEYYGSSTVWIHVSFKYSGNRKENYTFNNHSKYGANNTFTLIA